MSKAETSTSGPETATRPEVLCPDRAEGGGGMSAAGPYTLAPEQYFRVLTSGLTGLLDSLDAGAERDSLRADLDALLLLAYQGQDVISEEPTPANRSSKHEPPKVSGEAGKLRPPLFAIATRLEEIKGVLVGVEQGLALVLQSVPPPEPNELLYILRDRLQLELKNLAAQERAVYELAQGEHMTTVPS